jgi:hypothetical protein
MMKRGWRDSSSAGLEQEKRAARLGSRRDIVTWFDFYDVDEGRPVRRSP